MANIYTKDNIAPTVSPDIERLPDAQFSQPTQKKVSKTQSFVSAIETSIAYQAPQAISNASDYVVDKLNQVIYDIPEMESDPNFNKWDIFAASELPDDAADKFDSFAKTEQKAIEFVSNYKLKQKQTEEAYANGLPSDMVSFMTNVGLDPSTYVSFGAGATMSVAKAAITGGLAAGTSAFMRRTVDETTTNTDALYEAAGGTILGGVLGGAVQGFTSLKAAGKLQAPNIKSYLDAARGKTGYIDAKSSVGAMATLEETAPKIARGAQTASKAFGWVSPTLKGQLFENDTVRKYSMGMMGATVRTEGKVGISVKDIVYDDTKKVQRLINDSNATRQAWRKRQVEQGVRNPSATDFDNEWWNDAMNIMPASTKEVSEISAKMRQSFDEFATRGEKLMPQEFKRLSGYGAPLVIDGKLAQNNFEGLVDVYRNQLRNVKSYAAELTDAELDRLKLGLTDDALADFERQRQTLIEYREYDIEDQAIKMASEVADGLSDHVWGMEKSNPVPRFFNSRTANPKDFTDFAVKNPERLIATYNLNVSPQLATAQVFGTTDASTVITRMRDEIEAENVALRGKLVAGGDKKVIEKQIAKNKKEYDAAASHIADSFAMINKTKHKDFYKNNPKLAELLGWNDLYVTMRDQEGSGILQLTELAAIPFHHGFMKAIGKNGKALMAYISSKEVREAVRLSANMSGRSLEIGSIKAFSDILLHSEDVAEAGLKSARAREIVGSMFSAVTVYKHIIGFTRDIASITQDMVMIENLRQFTAGTLKPKYLKDMAFLGLDENNIKPIMAQIEKHSYEVSDGIPYLNLDKWDDKEAAQIMRIALQRDMRRAVNDITTGDINYNLMHPLIKPLVKLRSWSIGASQTYLLNGLTRPDADQMASLLYLTLAGGLINEAKKAALGQPTSNDASEFMWDGLKTSGMGGIYNTLFLDELAQTAGVPMDYDAYSIFTNPAAVIAGVNKRTYDQLSNIPDAVSGDQRAWERLKRALPMQQYPFIRQALDIDNK